MCTGVFALAWTGLLDGVECTTRLPFLDDLAAQFPKALVQKDRLLTHNAKQRIWTSAGGSICLDPPPALLADFAEGANMYFTHSYAVADDADAADVLARTHYTRSFPCIVRHGNVWGCQFHPEKSSALGQRILKNFVNIVEEADR